MNLTKKKIYLKNSLIVLMSTIDIICEILKKRNQKFFKVSFFYFFYYTYFDIYLIKAKKIYFYNSMRINTLNHFFCNSKICLLKKSRIYQI